MIKLKPLLLLFPLLLNTSVSADQTQEALLSEINGLEEQVLILKRQLSQRQASSDVLRFSSKESSRKETLQNKGQGRYWVSGYQNVIVPVNVETTISSDEMVTLSANASYQIIPSDIDLESTNELELDDVSDELSSEAIK
tara:strand:+ start:618 stop:1037 length:420 start_codon:yes stop_codon:yes gene_type:complete